MGFQIEDGTGSGQSVKVADNKLFTYSLIEFPMENYTHKGIAFSAATDFIALTTTASFSGILYLTETSTINELHVEWIRSSSTVNCLWKILKNPTAGTLISAGTNFTPNNLNFSSGNTFTGAAKKGADAQTVTDGTVIAQWMTSAYNPITIALQGGYVLNTGNSFAIIAQPTATGSVACTSEVWEEPQ